MKKNILEYLEETAARIGDKVALCDDNEQLSYNELKDGARRIGSAIAKKGITKQAVLIYMEKGPSEIMAFMGTVYAGCYYVPLDAEMPYTRIKLIIESTNAAMVITDEATKEKVDKLGFERDVCLCSQLKEEEIAEELLGKIRKAQLDIDPLYLLYTSGSTGVPKGVVGHHRGVIDYIDHISEVLELSENTIFGNQAPVYFDASLKEIYGALKSGATLRFIPKSLFMFPVQMINYLNEHKINTICWVPTALTMLSGYGAFEEVTPKYVHTICFGGEVFPVTQYKRWLEVLPDAKYVNVYGPTETTGASTVYVVDREFEDGEVIPLGAAFDNTGILLIKEDGTEAGVEEPGEIYIRGTGVTHGYYNNPEKTKEVFIQNPLNKMYNEIVYKTGDLAKINKRGEIVFISRKDYQIKHMGHRIELGEIDANVETVDGIKSCCTIYSKEDEKIVLFYEGDVDKRTLTTALKDRVPRYMIPNAFMQMEKLPKSATGKMNRLEMLELYKKEKENNSGRRRR